MKKKGHFIFLVLVSLILISGQACERKDKGEGVQCHPPPDAALHLWGSHIFQRDAGNKREIGRNQRKHAGGEKRKETGSKGNKNIDIRHCFFSNSVRINSLAPGLYQLAGPNILANAAPLEPTRYVAGSPQAP